MKYPWLITIVIVVVCSCTVREYNTSEEIISKRAIPLCIALDTSSGYVLNPVTGDSILPVKNSQGETIRTGVSISVQEKLFQFPSPVQLTPVKGVTVEKTPLNLDIEVRARAPKIQKLEQLLPHDSVSGDRTNSTFVLRNGSGERLETGLPVPVTGRISPCRLPHAKPSLPPGMKDNANRDIKYMDVYHGLPSAQIITMLEDRRGNFWFGTTSGGIIQYNGFSLRHFTEENGFSSKWVTSILEDKKGNLWFGTFGDGTIYYDGEQFVQFSEEEGLSDNRVEALFEDHHGDIWIGTEEGGVCRWNGNSLTRYTSGEGLPDNSIQAISEDSTGKLWLGTRNGICSFDNEKFQSFTVAGQPWKYPVSSMLLDCSGDLWIGTNGGGVLRLTEKGILNYTEEEGLGHYNIEDLVEDSRGNIWIASAGGGVTKFDGDTFVHLTEESGLSGNWVRSMHVDSQGNLWLGTIGGGLSIYSNSGVRHLTERQGLSSRSVYSMMEDSRGNLWFGTMFGGICMFNGESFFHYANSAGFGNITVESIMEDRRGNIWFGTGTNGIFKYDGQSFSHIGENQGMDSFSVGAMLEDRQGTLWFATLGGGIYCYRDGYLSRLTEKNGLRSNAVESILQDSRGNLWFGYLLSGISSFDGESIKHYTEKEGFVTGAVGCMMEDQEGNLWIGSMSGGLCIFNGENFSYFTKQEGLISNLIQAFVETKEGSVWISTKQGLTVAILDSRSDTTLIYPIDLHDGLKGMHFLQNSGLLDSKNRLWWGTNKSLTVLNMDLLRRSEDAPVLDLDRIDINGKAVDFRDPHTRESSGLMYDSVARFRNYPINPKMQYSKNHLTFHFTAIDWNAPYRVKFSYKLDGLDETWSVPGSDNNADYRNIPYGTHSFMVKAMGESLQWSEPFEYIFTVAPPWWHTWWMRITFVFFAVLVLILVVRWRTTRLRQRQKKLENTVRERTVEISDINEELKSRNENLAEQRDEIMAQRDEIEAQRDTVSAQKDQIELQKQSLTDSIEYAQRIQSATLPPDEMIQQLLPEHFILYRPLDIVSGDFYWMSEKNGQIILAVADCTGHGVPGAFMSMLGLNMLNDIVNSATSPNASYILGELRNRIISSLRQTGRSDEARDGMDIALCILDRKKMTLQYAGAHHPLYLARESELQVIKGDPMPIGISPDEDRPFTNHDLLLREADTLYLFSDGYVDQLGGERRKRFKTTQFKQILLDNQNCSMPDQLAKLKQALDEWTGLTGLYAHKYDQIDDILVVGIRM